jgi:hypothetical protein
VEKSEGPILLSIQSLVLLYLYGGEIGRSRHIIYCAAYRRTRYDRTASSDGGLHESIARFVNIVRCLIHTHMDRQVRQLNGGRGQRLQEIGELHVRGKNF